jgi:hypothetical protein
MLTMCAMASSSSAITIFLRSIGSLHQYHRSGIASTESLQP